MTFTRNGMNRRQLLQTTGAAAGLLGLGALGRIGAASAAAPPASTSGSLTLLASGDLLPY
jgi:nitrous oxide reductase